MDTTELKTNVIISVTLVGIAFIILTALLPQFSFVFLSIEVILLPAIYSYASERNEKMLRDHYHGLIEKIEERTTDLERKNQKLKKGNLK